MYDRIRLASFAHRIAKADRVVGTYARSSATLTLTGEDARSVVRAVSLAAPHRPPFGMASSCSYFSKAMFYNGTNVLDYVVVCGPYFLIHSDPPYEEDRCHQPLPRGERDDERRDRSRRQHRSQREE